MRILAACSLGGAGHFNPLGPFLRAARRRGDEVLTVGPPALREMVESAGFPFWAGGEPAEEQVAAIRERLPVAPPLEASVLGNRELFGRLATAAMLPHVAQLVEEWSPHLVLREPCEYASAVVAAPLGIPTAQVAISLAEAEAGSIEVAAPALEQYRQSLPAELRASPYVTRFPASLDPSPFPNTVRCHEPAPVAGASLPDWWHGSDAPLVYVTFGTVLGHMTSAREVYRIALQAVADLDVRVLLTVGRHFDLASLGQTRANVHVEAWVDQHVVLEHAALVVCHGGSGTVFGALAAGTPLIVVPLFADQYENGRRVADRGAGLVVKAERRVIDERDVAGIAAAIDDVMDTNSYAQHAREVATEMAATAT